MSKCPTNEKSITSHYSHGALLTAITDAMGAIGKTPESITMGDLAAVDEFHVGGRDATEHLLAQLNFARPDHVLDVGCGLGGPARTVASMVGCHVTGVDLTQEFIDTGDVLSQWVELNERVLLRQGSALAMPFEDATFAGGYMCHVGMNIEDKRALFGEVYRVLQPGARFGVYDIMRMMDRTLDYPVPWATTAETSFVALPSEYEDALTAAGFGVHTITDRRTDALEVFDKMRQKNHAAGGPPPLGLHTLIGESAPLKFKNMIGAITAGTIAPMEMIAQKPA